VAADEELEGVEEEDEAVEIGIEISACPPGKKIANLAMLSGGERSLTSLALLFAVIAHNPPPFAVLDEVEAALDEANSRRFGNMLRELSKHTQFVAITHNRETMRQANLIYGVTMGGDGISQLLSMKLDQALEAE
jgi:chromosome segregation protein